MIQTGEFFKQIKEWNQECRAKLQKEDLQQVCDLMLLIRGMALMSGCYQIAHIAELGEDIAAVGQHPKNSSNRRKCIGSVWDVVTTLDHLIATGVETTTEEQNILIHRINATLMLEKDLRVKVNQAEIDVIVRGHQLVRDGVRSGD
jgi:hypothetical protein